MHIVLTIKESSYGLWCITSGATVLFDRLHFAHAVRLARGLAREEHASSGRAVRVEMACSEFSLVLASYAGSRQSAAAA